MWVKNPDAVTNVPVEQRQRGHAWVELSHLQGIRVRVRVRDRIRG